MNLVFRTMLIIAFTALIAISLSSCSSWFGPSCHEVANRGVHHDAGGTKCWGKDDET